jgi:hypothetical protein
MFGRKIGVNEKERFFTDEEIEKVAEKLLARKAEREKREKKWQEDREKAGRVLDNKLFTMLGFKGLEYIRLLSKGRRTSFYYNETTYFMQLSEEEIKAGCFVILHEDIPADEQYWCVVRDKEGRVISKRKEGKGK